MSLYKRGKTWHTDFTVNGQRFRQSLDTTDWREAQSKQKDLMAQASEGRLSSSGVKFARLGFTEAAERYRESRKLELSETSQLKERHLLTQPCLFFKSELLSRISSERLISYREWRIGQKVSPATINMEIGVIRRILKRAKRWHLIASDLKPLKERRQFGRAMSLDEKLRLLRLAAKNPDWQTARLAMTLALNTTMRGCEIKALRWRDIDLMSKLLTIQKSKTEAGERVIPLNDAAFIVIMELRDRAKGISGLEHDHFVFPSCENGHFDPTVPQKSWRSAWRQLTRVIECPQCGKLQKPGKECRNKTCKANIENIKSPTAGLRFHDLRHHAITELAESQTSDQTIMAIAGHVSSKMLAHYSHVRVEAKRKALDAISGIADSPSTQRTRSTKQDEKGGHVTNNVTNDKLEKGVLPELLENDGRPEWIRTIDLFRVKEAL